MKNLIRSWALGTAQLALLSTVALIMPSFAQHAAAKDSPAKLVQDVRAATQQYLDVNNATAAGYGPAFGCVSGSDHGAMGIHYVNATLVGDGDLNISTPEALIYEPVGNARKLVGVEYIVDSATWLANHNNVPPSLDDQDFLFVPAPNRFNLNSFFELHVWAWRDNPQGAFVDWNNQVSCEHE